MVQWHRRVVKKVSAAAKCQWGNQRNAVDFPYF